MTDKKYTLEFTEINGEIFINSENRGFSPFEISGLMYHKLTDINAQVNGELKPEIVKRVVVSDD